MSKLNLVAVLLSLIFFTNFAAFAVQKLDPGNYDVDTAHSKVGFEVTHLVISSVEGKFKVYKGNIEVAPKFEKSKVNAEVDIASIDTGTEKRDMHLKSGDFFDAAKFPKMIFKSKSITGTPDNFKMVGDLTIRGKTKSVTFGGKYNGSAADGFGNMKVGFNAQTKISRKDFGLSWNKMVEAGPMVGDEVTIDLKIEAAKPLKQAAN